VISENWAKIKKEKITTDYKHQYDTHTFMGKKQYYTYLHLNDKIIIIKQHLIETISCKHC